MAFGEEVFGSETLEKQILEANKNRIEQWKKTSAYQQCLQDREEFEKLSPIGNRRISLYVKQLNILPQIEHKEIGMMYRDFVSKIHNAEQFGEFMGYLKDYGGLCQLAQGLFSAKDVVRKATVILLQRIENLGICDLSKTLNMFLMLAYHRLQKEYGEVDSLGIEESMEDDKLNSFGTAVNTYRESAIDDELEDTAITLDSSSSLPTHSAIIEDTADSEN